MEWINKHILLVVGLILCVILIPALIFKLFKFALIVAILLGAGYYVYDKFLIGDKQ